MDTFYGDIYKRKDNTRRYNLRDNISENTFIKIETEGESQEPRSIQRAVRNPQFSYNNSEVIFKDVADEHEHCKFDGFALATEKVEFASESTIFQEAMKHPDPMECEAWRDAIKKEINGTIKRGVWKELSEVRCHPTEEYLAQNWCSRGREI